MGGVKLGGRKFKIIRYPFSYIYGTPITTPYHPN